MDYTLAGSLTRGPGGRAQPVMARVLWRNQCSWSAASQHPPRRGCRQSTWCLDIPILFGQDEGTSFESQMVHLWVPQAVIVERRGGSTDEG